MGEEPDLTLDCWPLAVESLAAPSRTSRTLRVRIFSGNTLIEAADLYWRGLELVMGVEKILTLEQAFEVVEDLKRRGKRVVFTNGCFDLLHPGHTRVLAEARKLGDVLIATISTSQRTRAKGAGAHHST